MIELVENQQLDQQLFNIWVIVLKERIINCLLFEELNFVQQQRNQAKLSLNSIFSLCSILFAKFLAQYHCWVGFSTSSPNEKQKKNIWNLSSWFINSCWLWKSTEKRFWKSKMKSFIRQLPTSSVVKRPYFADTAKNIQMRKRRERYSERKLYILPIFIEN